MTESPNYGAVEIMESNDGKVRRAQLRRQATLRAPVLGASTKLPVFLTIGRVPDGEGPAFLEVSPGPIQVMHSFTNLEREDFLLANEVIAYGWDTATCSKLKGTRYKLID